MSETLGNELEEYKIDVGEVLKYLVFCLIAIAMGLFIAIGALQNPEAFGVPLAIIGGLLAIFMVAYGGWLAGRAIWLWQQNPKITLYENGVTWEAHQQKKFWRWQDFTEIKGFFVNHSLYGAVTIMKSGEWNLRDEANHSQLIIVPLYKRASALSELIIMQVTAALYPQYLAAFDRGESLTFGDLTLNQQTITYHKQEINWHNLIGLQIRGQWLYITSRNAQQPIRLKVATIANLYIMLRLAEHQTSKDK